MTHPSITQIILGCIMVVLFIVFLVAEAQLLYARVSRWLGRGDRQTRAQRTVEEMFAKDVEGMEYRKSTHGMKEGRHG